MSLVLHSAWRASAPYRVRIGLGLKGLDYAYAPVNLAEGEQRSAAYRGLNAQALVPTLTAGDLVLTQSLAILEWLDETYPDPALMPADPAGRAVVRAMCGIIACDIHPLNNLRVLKALADQGRDEAQRTQWVGRWITEGFDALEPMIRAHGRGWAYGETPTLADCVLTPQLFAASRFGFDIAPYPAIAAAAARAAEHPAFIAARPERQPDAA